MKKKTMKKIIVIFYIILALILIFNMHFVDAKQKIDKDQIELGTPDAKSSEDIGNRLFGIVRVMGILISVGVLAVVGIKYMLSSVQERADKKKMFVYYIIGAVLVFGISNFAEAIFDIVNGVLED